MIVLALRTERESSSLSFWKVASAGAEAHAAAPITKHSWKPSYQNAQCYGGSREVLLRVDTCCIVNPHAPGIIFLIVLVVQRFMRDV